MALSASPDEFTVLLMSFAGSLESRMKVSKKPQLSLHPWLQLPQWPEGDTGWPASPS